MADAAVLTDLTWDLEEAITMGERAVRAGTTPSWASLDALAAALAAGGRFAEATRRAREALDFAAASGNNGAASQIPERLRGYETNRTR